MVHHRKSCKKLSFTGLPPMENGFFDRDNRYVAYPEAGIRTPGFRGSTKKQTFPDGRTQDSRSYQNVERTEPTPGVRKGHRRPSAFTQQQNEGAETNEKTDGAAQRPLGKADADMSTDDREQGRDGKIESNNGEEPEKSTDEKLSSKSDSCADKGEGGLCSGAQEKKSVAIATNTDEACDISKPSHYKKWLEKAKKELKGEYKKFSEIKVWLHTHRHYYADNGTKCNLLNEVELEVEVDQNKYVKNVLGEKILQSVFFDNIEIDVEEFLFWLLRKSIDARYRSSKSSKYLAKEISLQR